MRRYNSCLTLNIIFIQSFSNRAGARTLIGGCIFKYWGSARLISFEINFISKETSQAEPEYINIHPSINAIAPVLFLNDCSNHHSIFYWSETFYLILFNFSMKMLRLFIKIILKLISKCLVTILSLTSGDEICTILFPL